jgi:tetratricopeptide (TPR) repeat protein
MAEISPELAEKIRELSARYEENPGRFFVPLANAYRDAGEIAQAEELLRSGLKRYTGYLSAHIVLGRCLADRGAVEEAAHEFRYVLSVDPQNLIALRTLGEMAAAQGRPDEAGRWYRELLAVDPMNKEARDELDALGASADAGAEPSAAPPQAVPGYGDLGSEFGLVDIESGSAEGTAHEASAEFGMVEPGAANELHLSTDEAGGQGSELADFGVVDLTPPAAPPAQEPSPEPAGPAIDFGGWGEVSLDDEAQASAEPKADDRMREYDTFSFGDVELGAAAAGGAPAEGAPLEAASAQAPGAGYDLAPQDEDEEVVTETMAELYARQGFHDRAIDVYRELVRRRGDEPALVRRLAELETIAAKEAGSGVESAVIEPPTLHTAAFLEPVEDVALPVIETGLPGLNFSPGGDLPFEPVDASAEEEAPGEIPVLEGLSFGTQDEQPASAADESTEAPSAADWTIGGVGDDATLPFPPSLSAQSTLYADVENDAPPAPVGESPELTEPAEPVSAAVESTGDAFADTFAYGFGEPGPEGASAPAPQAAAPQPLADELPAPPQPAAVEEGPEPVTASTEAPRAVGSYLSSLLSWRPAQPAEAPTGEQPVDQPSSPAQPEIPTEEPQDAAPSADLPWLEAPAAESPEAESPAPAAEPPPAQAEAPAAGQAEPAPWDAAPWEEQPAAPVEPVEPEPFEVSSLGFDLPPQPVGEPTVQESAEEPLPWEMGSPEAPPPPAPVPETPRQSPTPPEGGFSFEDFFSAPPSEPEPAPAPPSAHEPVPPAVQAEPGPPEPGGGEEDEDLESFQAWLQSLKR